MDEGQLRTWLDTNNQKLLAEIEGQIPVKFTLWGKESYGCQVHKNDQGEKCEVEVYYKEPPTQAKIAHELLHAKVDPNNRISELERLASAGHISLI